MHVLNQPRPFRRVVWSPVVLGLAGLASVLLAGCGTPKASSAGTASSLPVVGAPAPTVAGGGAAPVTTSGPTTTARDTPECSAMYQFQMAQYSTSYAPKDKQDAYTTSARAAATAAKDKIADTVVQAAITKLDELLPKSLTGGLSAEELASTKKASEDLDAWWKRTCL